MEAKKMQYHLEVTTFSFLPIHTGQCVIIKNEFNYESFISFSHSILAAFYSSRLPKQAAKKSFKRDAGDANLGFKMRNELFFRGSSTS